ncbi:MAG: TIGR00295 family protein [Candidatus Thermoplasmatota archaeon]
MNKIPDAEYCVKLLREYGCSDEVINHCKAVCDVALRIAKRLKNVDIALVTAGALLHDIGRGRTHGIRHAVEGACIAREIGLPKSLVNVIERHIGAGIPEKEAEHLGLPVKNYMPRTLEEKIVCHADNLVEGSKRQPVINEINKALAKGHHEYAKRLKSLHDELSSYCGIDLDYI